MPKGTASQCQGETECAGLYSEPGVEKGIPAQHPAWDRECWQPLSLARALVTQQVVAPAWEVVAQQGQQHGSREVGSTKDACKVLLPHLGLHPEGLNRQNFQGNYALRGFSLGKEWGWL